MDCVKNDWDGFVSSLELKGMIPTDHNIGTKN